MASEHCYVETEYGQIAVLPAIVRMFIAAELANSNKFRPYRFSVSPVLRDYVDTKERQNGIRVESDNGKVNARLRVEVAFGTNVASATGILQARLNEAIRVGTGLNVSQIGIDVEGVFFDEEEGQDS